MLVLACWTWKRLMLHFGTDSKCIMVTTHVDEVACRVHTISNWDSMQAQGAQHGLECNKEWMMSRIQHALQYAYLHERACCTGSQTMLQDCTAC